MSYVLRSPNIDSLKDLNESQLIKTLLVNRSISDVKKAQRFLNPDYDLDRHDPFALKDMDKVVERIEKALDNNERIVIYSDYDTDGIPGATIWTDYFRRIGYGNFRVYIPHRHDEGFGFHAHVIEELTNDNTNLIITVDCGINDIEAVYEAKENGIDVILSDHHIPAGKLPEAYAIINPKQEHCRYPEKMLCGSGVTFKIIEALLIRNRRGMAIGQEKWLLDMVCIATIADMVPLVGENRIFAYYGLKVLRQNRRLGLKALAKQAGLDLANAQEDDIGFTLSPRINAASRMGISRDAYALLSSCNIDEAELYAKNLEKINKERKAIVAHMVAQATARLAKRGAINKVIVIGDPDWKPSLVGLLANNLCEKFHVPVFAWGTDGSGVYKGSCRAPDDFDLVACMQKLPAGSLLQYGGHAQSGGFSVSADMIHRLPSLIHETLDSLSDLEYKPEIIGIDSIFELDSVDDGIYKQIERLGPYGIGNEKPLFLFRNIMPRSVSLFGKTKEHTEMVFDRVSGRPLKAIAFFVKPEHWQEKNGVDISKNFDLIAHIEKSYFGRPNIRLRIIDILPPYTISKHGL